MNPQPRIPDAERSAQLLVNLRNARLALAESNLELAELNAKFDQQLSQQRLQRLRQSRSIV